MRPLEALEALGHREKLEDLSARFSTPHIPEYELDYFKHLYHPELREIAAALGTAKSAQALAARGRVRRILGDHNGAAQDLKKALDLEPSYAPAHAWLGELALDRPEAELSLTKAIAADPDLSCAYLYRGAARLLKGEVSAALKDLERLPESGLALILLGLADRKRAFRSFTAAARKNPVCSAAYLLASKTAPDPKTAARFFREAYNVSPVLGFITLQIDRAFKVESPRYIKRIRGFAFRHPEKVGAYYKREATQSHFSHFPAEDYAFVKRLVAINDHLAWAHGFFGRAACYTEGGVPEGIRNLTRAIELAPHAGWFYAWRANARRIKGQLDGALEDFNTAIRLQPFYHRSFVWRGSLFRKMGRFPEALADLDRALAMDPFYSLTYYERSVVLRKLGDFVSSAFDLDRAFMLDHRYNWVFKTGSEPSAAELEGGLAELDGAIAAHPSVASLWAWRGQLKLQRRDYPAAFADLERAVRMDPFHALAFGWYGYGMLHSGRSAAAVGLLENAVSLEPRFWVAYGWLAQAEHQSGRKALALRRLKHVLEEKPKTPWAYYLYAKFDFEAGKARSALTRLKRALLLDGKYPDAYLLQAQARLAVGDARGALASVQRCIEIAPNLGRAYVVRAAINERTGRAARALGDYRLVLKDFPYLFNEEQKTGMEAALAGAAQD